MSNYPPGVKYHPLAPWNQPDEVYEGWCLSCGSENVFTAYSKIRVKVWDKKTNKLVKKWDKREVAICRSCFKKHEV